MNQCVEKQPSRKSARKILLIILICMAVLFTSAGVAWLVIDLSGIIITGNAAYFLDEYDEYFMRKEEYQSNGGLFGMNPSDGYKIWVNPLRKKALLRAIEEDICTEVSAMVENNPDMFQSYEINEDYTVLTVFYYEDIPRHELNGHFGDGLENQQYKITNLMVAHFHFNSRERFGGTDGMFVFEPVPRSVHLEAS